MIKIKSIVEKIVFCMFVMGLLFLVRAEVYAETVDQNGLIVDESKEDPLYARYHTSMELMSSGSKYTISTAKKKLSHQSVFSEKYTQAYGIDVSRYQENIDWAKVKADGVEFVIIRLGYRGMSDGSLVLDPYFEQNIKGAYEAGIDVGVYFFTQAVNTTEAKKEAEFCIENLKAYKSYVKYPVIIDLEPCGGRLDAANLSKAKKTSICETFCSTVEAAGYTGGIYCSKSYFTSWLNISQLENIHYIWLAHYTDSTDYTGRYDMWQFSSSCSVNGISGYVDMDVAYNLNTPTAPTNLNQTVIADDSLTFTWNHVVGADGYKVYQYDENGTQVKTYSTTETSISITGLSTGNIYQYKVRSYYIGTDGTKKYSKYSPLFVTYTKADKVTGVVTDSRTADSVTISWKALKHAEGYRVRLYNREDGSYETVASVKTSSCVIPDLVAAYGYDVVVQAYVKMNGDTKKYGTYSDVATVYTTTSAVTSVTFSNLKKTSMTVAWKKQSSAIGYRVVWYDEKGKKIDYKDTVDTSWKISRLSTGTKYRIKVRSYYMTAANKKILGPFSSALVVTTLPAKVSTVKQSDVQTESLQLSWKAKKGASGYRVYCYDSATKTYKRIKTTTKTTCTMKNLRAATKYKIKVVAYVTNGSKKYVTEESSVYQMVTRPSNVKGLKQTAKTKSTATVSWTKVPRAVSYQLKIYNSKNKLVGTYVTANTSYKFKNLSGKYTVKVRAYVKSTNASAYSAAYTKGTLTTK